ncbi:hypothetical protein GWK47_036727 [Chionoecetes opilio]|uniref:Uncharacterized protein n=1 Tax=Chionoecetes opilio TaxID=41210 RepID=A0A8J5D1R0_CHIOP|nr:hypothetical protein GWK47_036727 [Chionoecetes opilio]
MNGEVIEGSRRDQGLIPLCDVQEGHEVGNVLHGLQLVSGQLYLNLGRGRPSERKIPLAIHLAWWKGTWGPDPVVFPEVSSQERVYERPEEFFVALPGVECRSPEHSSARGGLAPLCSENPPVKKSRRLSFSMASMAELQEDWTIKLQRSQNRTKRGMFGPREDP